MSDQAYVELVRSMFDMLLPSIIMSMLFVGVALLAVAATGDRLLLILGGAGTLLSVVRLSVVIACRARGLDRIANRALAIAHERIFGLSYMSFALVLGLFGTRTMVLMHVGVHMVVTALLVGYAAGVAAGIALRPRIAAASMVLAVVPPAAASLVRAETFHLTLALVLLALLAGGLQNMHARYRAEIEKIEMRRAISGLARRDHLTGLPNRLGLAERFDEATAAHGADCLVAVHCLDLDRFKPVNDEYGHPTGDELLRQVAGRLTGVLRRGDLASRVGGDEFVVLQCGMQHVDEADLLARRLTRALGEPYTVGDFTLSVGVSVGFVVSRCDSRLEDLVGRADNALYGVKALGGGAAEHSDIQVGKALVARA